VSWERACSSWMGKISWSYLSQQLVLLNVCYDVYEPAVELPYTREKVLAPATV